MTTITIAPERPDTADAQTLIAELEEHLAPQYPAASRHGYSVERLIAQGVAFFVLRIDGTPVGCGGIQLFDVGGDAAYGELKRMYVRPSFRARGLGARLVAHLEGIARESGVGVVRLETGIHQTAAMRLYEQMGYVDVGPFGDYHPDPLSRFYEKRLVGIRDGEWNADDTDFSDGDG